MNRAATRAIGRPAQGHVQCRTVFAVIDVLAREHLIDPGADIALFGKRAKLRQAVIVEPLAAEVEEQAGRLPAEVLGAPRVRVEQRADTCRVESGGLVR